MLDTKIINGEVIDGTGLPRCTQDIGILGEEIVEMGKLNNVSAHEEIDARDLIVAPGFIDTHSHVDLEVLSGDLYGTLSQGICTQIGGLCGWSLFPVEKEKIELLKFYLAPIIGNKKLQITWENCDEYLDLVKKRDLLCNFGTLVGHGSIRLAVMGFADREPSEKELLKMKDLLRKQFEGGSLGLSFGLNYPPGCFSITQELIELASIAALYEKPCSIHIRNESSKVVESVKEVIKVAEKSGAKIIISHHKAAGKPNFGKTVESIALIDDARQKGLDIWLDVYPYLAGSTMMSILYPSWALEGGITCLLERLDDPICSNKIRKYMEERTDWDNFILSTGWENLIVSSTASGNYEGVSLLEVANMMGKDPFQAASDLFTQEKGSVVIIISNMSEEDLARVLCHPASALISDAIIVGGNPHPRVYGSFPRFLGRYVREKGLLSWEEAIRKITSLPASNFNIKNRGKLAIKKKADIVIFDQERIEDKATFQDPTLSPEGIRRIFINGKLQFTEGKPVKSIFSGSVVE